MRVRKKFLQRAMSLLLAIVCLVGACGLDVSAACPSGGVTMHTGWYCLAGPNSGENTTWGKAWSVTGGKTMTGIPTHCLYIGGKWVWAQCLNPKAGATSSDNFDIWNSYYCKNNVASSPQLTDVKRCVLAALLYKIETLYPQLYTVTSGGSIGKRGGSQETDWYCVAHLLTWGVLYDHVIMQGNGKIGLTDGAKGDLDFLVNCLQQRHWVTGGYYMDAHRPQDGRALRGRIDNLIQNLTWCYSIPDFCVYTSTHPLGDRVAGKPGNAAAGYNGVITLDKSCKRADGTYHKEIIDNSGVLAAFDFSDQFGPGFSGVWIKREGNKLIIDYDGSTGCWEDWTEEKTRDLPFGPESVLVWSCGADDYQQPFATHVKSSSKLGCKFKLVIKDCNVTITPPSAGEPSWPITSVTPPSDSSTPPVETSEPSTPTPETPNVGIRKTSEDGKVAGITFTITGGGQTYHKVTDETGYIDVSDLPQYVNDGTGNPDNRQLIEYHIEEEIPIEYIHDRQNASKNFVLEGGKPVSLEFHNTLKKWQLTFKKHDDALATQAQGKGSLAGAEFGVYKDNVLLDTYITDENGMITTKEYPCGPGYTLIEICPPPGYMSDSTVYAIGLLASETTEEHNQCNRLEPLDGDDPDVIRQAYALQSALKDKLGRESYDYSN